MTQDIMGTVVILYMLTSRQDLENIFARMHHQQIQYDVRLRKMTPADSGLSGRCPRAQRACMSVSARGMVRRGQRAPPPCQPVAGDGFGHATWTSACLWANQTRARVPQDTVFTEPADHAYN